MEAKGNRAPLSEDLPREVIVKIKVSRIPKNMYPEGSEDRRRERSGSLVRMWDGGSNTEYMDAARGQDEIATVALVSSDGEKMISVALVKKIKSEARADVVAIAYNPRATVLTDAQAACRKVARGPSDP